MKIVLTGIFLFFLSSPADAQRPAFGWALQLGSPSVTVSSSGSALAVDRNGNVYTIGSFTGTMDFDPGPGVYNRTAATAGSGYVLKTGPDGHFIWAMVTENSDIIYSVTEAPDGSILLSGRFWSELSMNTGTSAYTLHGATGMNLFMLKMDPAANILWGQAFPCSSNATLWAMTSDRSGNILFCGDFEGTVDFDPGPGSFPLSTGSVAAFVTRLDASGNLLWARQLSGAGTTGSSIAENIVTDDHDNIYLTGTYKGTVDFDPGPGSLTQVSAGDGDIFLLRLDTAGDLSWARSMGGGSDDIAYGLAIDPANNLFLTGGFKGTADFDPGAGVYKLSAVPGSSDMPDIFVTKLDNDGQLVWARSMGGDWAELGMSIAADQAGHLFLTGHFSRTVDFDPGPGVFKLSAPGTGTKDAFICELDTAGRFVWAGSFGGREDQLGRFITSNGLGLIYTTGSFNASVDFDPGPDSYLLDAGTSFDMFLVQLGTCSLKGTVETSGTTLQLKDKVTSCQWVRCPGYEVIPGATATSFTPAAGGNYAVILHKGGCTDTTDCIPVSVGIHDPYAPADIRLWPNPSSGILRVAIGNDVRDASLQLCDITGKIMYSQRWSGRQWDLDISGLAPGVYSVQLRVAGQAFRAQMLLKY